MSLLISQGILLIITVGFLAVDFLRLRVHGVKDVFIVLFGSMLRRREFSGLTGGSYLLLASLLSGFIFEPRVLIAATAYLALGDTMAAIVGLSIGRIRFWNKTVEGTLAGFICCVGLAFLSSLLPYWNLPIGVALLGAVVASVVEAMPIEVNDNVAVPIVSGLAMQVAVWLKVLGA